MFEPLLRTRQVWRINIGFALVVVTARNYTEVEYRQEHENNLSSFFVDYIQSPVTVTHRESLVGRFLIQAGDGEYEKVNYYSSGEHC